MAAVIFLAGVALISIGIYESDTLAVVVGITCAALPLVSFFTWLRTRKTPAVSKAELIEKFLEDQKNG